MKYVNVEHRSVVQMSSSLEEEIEFFLIHVENQKKTISLEADY